MTRYEAYVHKGWREEGMTQVLVVRKRGDGSADVGIFLVDVWCLGVKDADGASDLLASELDERIAEQIPEEEREAIHPACAKKLVEGAVAYAERLGFAPHRDFRKARRVLSGIDASLCPTDFEYGRDGRPCFVPGPDDTDERIDRVLAMLDARLGPEGYDFEGMEEDDEEEVDIAEVREELMEWLAAEPEEVPRFFRLSGLLTAAHLCPQFVTPPQIIDALWPEGRKWEDEEEAKEFLGLILEYWNYLGDRVQEASGDAETASQVVDVWESDLAEAKALSPEKDSPMPFMAALIEWAGGFWHATELWPEAWGDVLERPDLAPHWEMVSWWADWFGHREELDAAASETPPRNLGGAVTALVLALRPTAGGDE